MADEKEPGSAASGQDGEPRRYRDIPPEVQEILTAHQQWVESQGKEGQPAQLAKYDLNHLNLAGVNLQDANLQGANLLGARLGGTNLLDSKNLTEEQVKSAVIDEETKLPEHLKHLLPKKPGAPERSKPE